MPSFFYLFLVLYFSKTKSKQNRNKIETKSKQIYGNFICFVIALLALFALGFTSCSKDVEKCWKVDISMKFELMETSVTNYVWKTENDIESEIENLKREYADYPDVKMTIKNR